MTTDTTAPAADDLREAIRLVIAETCGCISSTCTPCRRADATCPCGDDADTILALIAPRIAAARDEGRREGIAEAAAAVCAMPIQIYRDEGIGPAGISCKPATFDDAITAIRALADAPRTAKRSRIGTRSTNSIRRICGDDL